VTKSPAELFNLTGKVALVTGASSGFGAHFSRVLAASGAKVVVAARRQDRLETLVAEIQSAGGEAMAVSMDVTDEISVASAFELAEAALGTVTLLVNNAGVAQPRPLHKSTSADWDLIMNTNLKGVWIVAAEAGRRMISAKAPGVIINIASVLGQCTSFGHGIYSASKAGVIQVTQHLALELASKNIRVNALCPGYFKTEMNEDYFASEQGQQYIQSWPGARLGEMDDINGPLLLLASDAGGYINGSALSVDGGFLVRSY